MDVDVPISTDHYKHDFWHAAPQHWGVETLGANPLAGLFAPPAPPTTAAGESLQAFSPTPSLTESKQDTAYDGDRPSTCPTINVFETYIAIVHTVTRLVLNTGLRCP
jgi:hypothetical protein